SFFVHINGAIELNLNRVMAELRTAVTLRDSSAQVGPVVRDLESLLSKGVDYPLLELRRRALSLEVADHDLRSRFSAIQMGPCADRRHAVTIEVMDVLARELGAKLLDFRGKPGVKGVMVLLNDALMNLPRDRRAHEGVVLSASHPM